MRHRKSGRKLKRTASHRRSLLANLATSLLRHKRITTTLAKAKETRSVVEKMITRARRAVRLQKDKPAFGVHARRQVGRMVKDRDVIADLFSSIADRVGERPGGYTRIVKLGQRRGDGAELASIELVDFPAGSAPEKEEKGAKAGRKKAAKKAGAEKAAAGEAAAAS